jgi:hypothetical protein
MPATTVRLNLQTPTIFSYTGSSSTLACGRILASVEPHLHLPVISADTSKPCTPPRDCIRALSVALRISAPIIFVGIKKARTHSRAALAASSFDHDSMRANRSLGSALFFLFFSPTLSWAADGAMQHISLSVALIRSGVCSPRLPDASASSLAEPAHWSIALPAAAPLAPRTLVLCVASIHSSIHLRHDMLQLRCCLGG